MSVIVTTNEPPNIRALFEDKVELPMDFDIMLLTNRGNIGLERKAVPGDLLASVQDGRLAREILAMRRETQYQILLLHGNILYRRDKTVYIPGGKTSKWTKKGIRNLLRSIQYVEGLYVEQAESDQELVDIIQELQEYFDKDKHISLRGRPGFKSDWIVATPTERIRYFYQGLPGISTNRAKQLCQCFPSPLMLYQASVEDIRQINGFGNGIANKIYNFLRSGID